MSNPVRSYAAILLRAAVMVGLVGLFLYYQKHGFTAANGEKSDAVDWLVRVAAAVGVILTFGRWVFEPVHKAASRFWAAVELMADIPGRVEALETALVTSQNQLRFMARRVKMMFEQSDIASFEANPEGDLVTANQNFADMCGLAENDLRGRGWLAAVHEDDRARVWERWSASRLAGLPYSQTFRLIDQKTDKMSTCRISASAFLDEAGKVISYDCTVKAVGTREILGQGGENGEQIMRRIASELTQAARRAGLEKCASMDVTFDNGDEIRIPLVPGGDYVIMPGVRMRLLSQAPDCTEYQLEVEGAETLPWHSHAGVETVKVQRGTLRDEESGRIYGAGETWTIPANQRHSVKFRNAVVIGTILPGLPTVKDAGMDMSRITSALINQR